MVKRSISAPPMLSALMSRHALPARLESLENAWLQVAFSEETGIRSFRHLGSEIGDEEFLAPFVSYRTRREPIPYPAARWSFMPLDAESWAGAERVRLKAEVPMRTPQGEHTSELIYTFTLFDELPHLYVDVEARLASTPPTEIIHTMMQKLRRLMDLRWVEVAPFQLHPSLAAPAAKPLRIWKHNYLGITSFYELSYGQVNPRNRNLDAFNHQVTAGWVAVSDGSRRLLVGESAEALASMAFCPMRLRERRGVQKVWLNPFGSYYGRQLDYSHLGGTGIGSAVLGAMSGALRPNGPSYNGQTLRFSLLLAPYRGDEPPAQLQAEASAHFYPPGAAIHAAPAGVEALLPREVREQAERELREAAIQVPGGIPPPTAFLANPSEGKVDLAWDAPRGVPVTGYEVEWRVQSIEPVTRRQVSRLRDGTRYLFRLRAVCGTRFSEWSAEKGCVPGAVTGSGLGGALAGLSIWVLVRMLLRSLWAVLRASWTGRRRAL